MPKIIKLRELPGIAEIERDLQISNAWAKEKDDLPARIDSVSLSLFGITDEDTEFDGYPEGECNDEEWEAAEKQEAEWELHFHFLELDYADAAPLWAAMGWDVTDGQGNELMSTEHFGAQIIATLKNLIPHAKFYPTGNGPIRRQLSDIDASTEAEEWGEAMALAAKNFQPSPR